MNAQLKKGNLDLCVLALLSRKDRYGYELVSEISAVIDMAEGTIYPLLKRIKDENLVTTYLEESSEGAPRKYYSITPAGIERKNALKDEWTRFTEAMNIILEG
ncbi:transcriptional regulator [Clostridia bacterium]|nr:transcriptional regulator [Clostridia bacterium]